MYGCIGLSFKWIIYIKQMDLEGIVDAVNEKHMIPWAEVCQKDGISNSGLSPYAASESLMNKNVSLDGSKLEESGFVLNHPKLTAEAVRDILQDFADRKLYPPSLLK
jgi:hypothetical protein